MPPRKGEITYLANTVEELCDLINTINSPYLGTLIDIGHAHLSGITEEMIKSCKDKLFALHVHDNDGEKDDHLMPGEGNINWKKIINLLNNIKYQGIFMLEVYPRGTTKEFLESVKNCQYHLFGKIWK